MPSAVQQRRAFEVQRERGEGKLPPRSKEGLAALGGLAVAVITVLAVFGWVDWSAAQTALATTEAGTAIGLITALGAHFYPASPREPVAVAATLTAWLSATLALGTGFNWWTLTQEQISALVALVTAVLGVGGAWLARGKVFSAPPPQERRTASPGSRHR